MVLAASALERQRTRSATSRSHHPLCGVTTTDRSKTGSRNQIKRGRSLGGYGWLFRRMDFNKKGNCARAVRTMNGPPSHRPGEALVAGSGASMAGSPWRPVRTNRRLHGSPEQSPFLQPCRQPESPLQSHAGGQHVWSAQSQACVITPPSHKAGTIRSGPRTTTMATIRLIRRRAYGRNANRSRAPGNNSAAGLARLGFAQTPPRVK